MTHNKRGMALKRLQRFDESLASYDRAIALKPDSPDVYNNRGNALTELKRLDDGVVQLRLGYSAQAQLCRGSLQPRLGKASRRPFARRVVRS